MSQISSTLVSEVLTCCPPGPELLEKRHVSAQAGIFILDMGADISKRLPGYSKTVNISVLITD